MEPEAPFLQSLATHPMFQLFPQLRPLLQAQPGFAELIYQLSAMQRGDITADIANQFFDAYTPPGPPPTDKAFLSTLEKQQRPVTADAPEAGKACAICMEEYALDHMVLPLPCHHTFHGACVLTWLQEHNTCPTCRHEFPVDPNAPRPPPTVDPFPPNSGGTRVIMDEDEFSEVEMQEAIRLSLMEAEANKIPTPEELRGMSVRELKGRLQRRRVDYSGAVEKEELVELLRHSYQ